MTSLRRRGNHDTVKNTVESNGNDGGKNEELSKHDKQAAHHETCPLSQTHTASPPKLREPPFVIIELSRKEVTCVIVVFTIVAVVLSLLFAALYSAPNRYHGDPMVRDHFLQSSLIYFVVRTIYSFCMFCVFFSFSR